MTSDEFVAELMVHFSKRHVSDEAEAKWLKDMSDRFRTADGKVLRKAAALLIAEHEERAFPLPATIGKFIARAAEIVHPESVRASSGYYSNSLREPDSREEIERCRIANEWQHNIIQEYGSWENWYRGIKGQLKSEYRPRDVSKAAFQEMQAKSKNRKMHADLGALSRRISGDRE